MNPEFLGSSPRSGAIVGGPSRRGLTDDVTVDTVYMKEKICNWHKCNNQITGCRKKFCSDGCKSNFYVTRNRHSNKQKLVDHFGGACIRCGYNKSLRALQFHHRDPSQKSFGIAQKGKTRAYEKLLAEAEKCDLICANCHAEEHGSSF